LIQKGSFLDVFSELEKDNFFCVDLTSKCNHDFFEDGNNDSNENNNDDDDDDDEDVDIVDVSNDREELVTRVFIDLTGGCA
jgi:hypothetical protein